MSLCLRSGGTSKSAKERYIRLTISFQSLRTAGQGGSPIISLCWQRPSCPKAWIWKTQSPKLKYYQATKLRIQGVKQIKMDQTPPSLRTHVDLSCDAQQTRIRLIDVTLTYNSGNSFHTCTSPLAAKLPMYVLRSYVARHYLLGTTKEDVRLVNLETLTLDRLETMAAGQQTR